MKETLLMASLIIFGIAIVITFIRIVIGPTFPDRVIAMDVVGVNLISAIAIISIIYDTHVFYDVILVLGILAFISTISYSKFLERGDIIEYKRDI
ncbi:MAG TPA: Na(+)/H(+) antiporter subunit F1 [Pseudogracilibacillus sp.]|nr:Na(+)/H(+) antiporter subunit F1 [Pseudogracilibacillus sp.]